MEGHNKGFMIAAIEQSMLGVKGATGGPFGAVVVKGGEIIARGYNQVTMTNDPTAHAEIVAIREACKKLNSFQLSGCEIYTSCEPCPMCMGAIYWARPDKVYYANTKADAAEAGFDDQFIETEFSVPPTDRRIPMIQMMRDEALTAFEAWKAKTGRIDY